MLWDTRPKKRQNGARHLVWPATQLAYVGGQRILPPSAVGFNVEPAFRRVAQVPGALVCDPQHVEMPMIEGLLAYAKAKFSGFPTWAIRRCCAQTLCRSSVANRLAEWFSPSAICKMGERARERWRS